MKFFILIPNEQRMSMVFIHLLIMLSSVFSTSSLANDVQTLQQKALQQKALQQKKY